MKSRGIYDNPPVVFDIPLPLTLSHWRNRQTTRRYKLIRSGEGVCRVWGEGRRGSDGVTEVEAGKSRFRPYGSDTDTYPTTPLTL